MSNSIWHKYDIKDMPSLTREILARNGSHHNVCIINREDWKQSFCEWIDRWAYVADIIAQADKAERLQKEVDLLEHNKNGWAKLCEQKQEQIQRLQKAVDYALQVLDDVIEIGGIDLAMIKIEQMIKETTND